MSVPAGEPDPSVPVDFESAIRATAERIKTAWSEDVVVPTRTMQGARIVWETIYGHLRGRIPYPVPPDLMGVAVSAGLRVSKGFANTGTLHFRQADATPGDFQPWTGFLIPERVVINRYRQRTA